MMNLMDIDGVKAVVGYDPEIRLFRGEFVGLNGGADFYAADVEGLQREGELSLKVFRAFCEERGIEPFKHYSGKFTLRLPAEDHAAVVRAAQAAGQSINQWATKVLRQAAHD